MEWEYFLINTRTVSPHEEKEECFCCYVIGIGFWLLKFKNCIMEWKWQTEEGTYPAWPLTQATINPFSNPNDTFFYIYSLPNSGIQVNSEILLASAWQVPAKLIQKNYKFSLCTNFEIKHSRSLSVSVVTKLCQIWPKC